MRNRRESGDGEQVRVTGTTTHERHITSRFFARFRRFLGIIELDLFGVWRAGVGTNLPTGLCRPLEGKVLKTALFRELIESSHAILRVHTPDVCRGTLERKRLRRTPAGGTAVISKINDTAPPPVCN